jgi:hypothetical protein
LATPSGRVHWIGTGLSTGGGLSLLCEEAKRVLVWGRTAGKAAACLARLGLTGQAATRAYSLDALAAELEAGDVVVSMLPATEHPSLLRLCVARSAHFACSSYVSDEILAEAPAAEAAGVVVLTEAGLDPGLDHVLAHDLVARAKAVVGDTAMVRFTSYCGGIPAVPNEFRYRFSWAPRGVLTALLNPARYVENGAEQVAARPWEATKPCRLAEEDFEVYPNRDSVPFIAQYEFPDGWQVDAFVRGTIRLDGWREAWAEVFEELRRGDMDRIDALAKDLAAKYPTTDADRDRVVLAVGLEAEAPDGTRWAGDYLLDLIGDDEESAMARCVSLPLAFGITGILDGTTTRPGLRRAAEGPEEVAHWLDQARAHGIDCVPTTTGAGR